MNAMQRSVLKSWLRLHEARLRHRVLLSRRSAALARARAASALWGWRGRVLRARAVARRLAGRAHVQRARLLGAAIGEWRFSTFDDVQVMAPRPPRAALASRRTARATCCCGC